MTAEEILDIVSAHIGKLDAEAFENTVGAQLGLIQQLSVSPQEAMSAIKSQLKVYTNTPSPL